MGATQSLTAPFFAPAAAREALTFVESINQVSKSTSPSAFSRTCSRSKMRSKVPSFVQMRYQWYALCQGPYRSGRSRQEAPLHKIQKMALSICLGSRRLRPVAFGEGKRSRMSCHCHSWSSYRSILRAA